MSAQTYTRADLVQEGWTRDEIVTFLRDRGLEIRTTDLDSGMPRCTYTPEMVQQGVVHRDAARAAQRKASAQFWADRAHREMRRKTLALQVESTPHDTSRTLRSRGWTDTLIARHLMPIRIEHEIHLYQRGWCVQYYYPADAVADIEARPAVREALVRTLERRARRTTAA